MGKGRRTSRIGYGVSGQLLFAMPSACSDTGTARYIQGMGVASVYVYSTIRIPLVTGDNCHCLWDHGNYAILNRVICSTGWLPWGKSLHETGSCSNLEALC